MGVIFNSQRSTNPYFVIIPIPRLMLYEPIQQLNQLTYLQRRPFNNKITGKFRPHFRAQKNPQPKISLRLQVLVS